MNYRDIDIFGYSFGGEVLKRIAELGDDVREAYNRLVQAGYPSSTAEKIATGELPMDSASKAARMQEQGYDLENPIYAGSYDPVAPAQIFPYGELRDGGGENLFGGIFGSFDPNVAGSHGSNVREYLTRNYVPSDDFRFDVLYGDDATGLVQDIFSDTMNKSLSSEEAQEMLDLLAGGKGIFVEAPDMGIDRLSEIMGSTDLGEIDFALQGLRGELARRKGYDAVGMPDEHGESVLLLRGRSPDAAFDPDQVDSPNLLAGLAPYAVPTAIGAGLFGAAMTPEEAEAAGFGTLAAGAAGTTQAGQEDVPDYMRRLDGTIKSERGFLGPIQNKVSGRTMTEVSVGQPGSEEGFYPLLVPTLTQEEIDTIANLDLGRERPPFSIIEKARAHAMERIDQGLSPFYQDGEGASTMMLAPEGAAPEDNIFGTYDPAAINLIDQKLAELQQRPQGQAGRTQRPQIDSITGADVLGGLEAAGTIGSVLLGAVPAGLEGLFKLARTGDVREAGDRVEEIQRALMYEPRTEEGMRALEATGSFLEPLGALGSFLGENVLEVTGSPELATLADVFAPDPTQIIPGLAGLKVFSSALPPIRVGRRIAQPAPEGTRAHNLPSPLLVQGPGGKPATPVVQTFTPANTEKVLEQIEAVKANNPSALSSTTNWLRMEGDAFGGDFLPAPPMRAIQYNINPEALATELQRLTPELKAGVDEGFEYVKQIRNVYNSEQADPALTGRLFSWGILSRGAGPVQQEAAFIDLLDNAQPFIEKAVRGEFTEADIDAWTAMVSRSLPEGSPAKQVTMNANAAGRLLFELGKKPEGSDQTVLERLHGILSDPNRTGREFRREFFRLTDKPGIDNKVVSFIGMVAGKDDLLIMDRIQTRNLWDDGRFEGANIYDGIREGNAKGGFNAILAGPRGLLVTEALEDGLIEPLRRAYEIIGRPEDASLARMHWETWNIGGNQAVSHSTLQNVRTGTSIGGAVTEGKRNTFSSGVTYRQAINGPITEYPLSDGSFVRMTPDRQKEFEAFIKDPKNGIVPKGFKVSSAQDRPWYEMPGINREKLDETARRFENANADGSLQSGARRVVEGGSTVSERRGGFLRALRRDRLAQQLAGRSGGLDSRGPSFTYQGKIGTDDEGARLLILEPSEEVASRYQFAGLNVPTLRQQPADSQVEYVASMRAALEDNPAREQVYIPEDPRDLAGARLFRTDNGSGFAIKEDGDVTAVFADPSEPGGSAYSMLEAAVQAGGRKLDAFDTYLPKIYETVGFRPVARLRWDDRQAPPGWDKAKYAEYNDGEPDVVFFVFDPAYQGKSGAKNVPYVDTYDQGMDVQNAEMARISPEVEAYLRQARPAKSSGVASLDPEPMAAGGAVRPPMPPSGIDALKAYRLRL